MTLIQIAYVVLPLLIVLYFLYRKRCTYRQNGQLVCICLRNRLQDTVQIGDIKSDPVLFWFRSELMMDEILSEIRRAAERLKYEYVHSTYESTLAMFSFEAPGERFKFKLRRQPPSQNSDSVSVYCLLLV